MGKIIAGTASQRQGAGAVEACFWDWQCEGIAMVHAILYQDDQVAYCSNYLLGRICGETSWAHAAQATIVGLEHAQLLLVGEKANVESLRTWER